MRYSFGLEMALEALINEFSTIIRYEDLNLVPVRIILGPVLKFDEGIIGFI